MAESVSQEVATQQPQVSANEATLSEFDDIPDEVISGMSGEHDDDGEVDEGSGESQPGAQFAAHEDESGVEPTSDESTGAQAGGESNTQVDDKGQQQTTEQQTQQTEQPPVQETAEQKAARETALEEQRKAFVVELEKSYQLTPEDADTALTQPEKVLPKLAANLHARVLQEVFQQVQVALPHMIEQVGRSTNTETQARNAFFEKWPQLNKPEYEKAIVAAGKMYRELNPKAPPDQAIAAIGELVSKTLGIDVGSSATTTTPAPRGKGVFTPNRSTGGARATPRQSAAKKSDDDSQPDWGELAKDE